MIKALLYKDWRMTRSLRIATAALYVTPLVVGGIWIAIPSNTDRPATLRDFLDNCAHGLVISAMVSLLATPLFGAAMFAHERANRTGDLVGAMPVPRGPVVASKAIVLFIMTLIPWLVTIIGTCVLWAIIRYGMNVSPPFGSDDVPEVTGDFFLLGILVLSTGSGWFFSSFLRKDTIAAGLSFLLTVGTIVQTLVIWYKMNPDNSDLPHGLLAGTTGGLGVLCFIAGTIIAMRRRTP